MRILILGLLLGTTFFICSCKEDTTSIPSETIVDLELNIVDSEGNKLLNRFYEKNIRSQEISATYNGKVYHLNEDREGTMTRIFAYSFKGLTMYDSGTTTKMFFGTLSFDEEYSEEISLNLGDGVERIIGFSGIIENGKFVKTFTLDGEKVDNSIIDIVVDGGDYLSITYRPLCFKFCTERIPNNSILTYKGIEYKYGSKEFKWVSANNGNDYIGFKEIAADETLINEPLTITWEDGSKTEIIINNYREDSGRLVRNVTLDGTYLGNMEWIWISE